MGPAEGVRAAWLSSGGGGGADRAVCISTWARLRDVQAPQLGSPTGLVLASPRWPLIAGQESQTLPLGVSVSFIRTSSRFGLWQFVLSAS